MKTRKEQQWVGTLKYDWHDHRVMLSNTIAVSKSDAITALLNDWPGVHEGCQTRRSKWKKMKDDKREFQVVPITLSVDGEDDEVEQKRCCDNCISFSRFGGDDCRKWISCEHKNIPGKIMVATFVCTSHQYYQEVFPDG